MASQTAASSRTPSPDQPALRWCDRLGFMLVYLGLGGAMGTLIGLISDFGLVGMFTAIRLNHDTFINQYLSWVLIVQWFMAIGTVILLVVRYMQGQMSKLLADHDG